MLSTFLIAIALLQGIFQIDNFLPFWKKAKPWIIIVLLIAVAVISIINENFKKAEAAKKQSDRDSVAEVKRKESNLFILNGIGNAIGVYKLGYDSVTKQFYELQKVIKDSANRKTTIIQGESPNINFDYDTGIVVKSFTSDSIDFTVAIKSYNAPSIVKNASIYCVYAYNQKGDFYRELKYDTSMTFLNKNLGLPKDATGSQSQKFKKNNLKKPIEFIILIKGTYTDSHGKNPQPLDIVGSYYLNSKNFLLTSQPYDDSVRIFLKRKGIIKKL